MKFRFIKKVRGKVHTYPGLSGELLYVKTGDVVEFNDFFSSKAMKSPHFERVTDDGVTVKKQVKKRAKKNGNKGRG